jgi:hypothetical protein
VTVNPSRDGRHRSDGVTSLIRSATSRNSSARQPHARWRPCATQLRKHPSKRTSASLAPDATRDPTLGHRNMIDFRTGSKTDKQTKCTGPSDPSLGPRLRGRLARAALDTRRASHRLMDSHNRSCRNGPFGPPRPKRGTASEKRCGTRPSRQTEPHWNLDGSPEGSKAP